MHLQGCWELDAGVIWIRGAGTYREPTDGVPNEHQRGAWRHVLLHVVQLVQNLLFEVTALQQPGG